MKEGRRAGAVGASGPGSGRGAARADLLPTRSRLRARSRAAAGPPLPVNARYSGARAFVRSLGGARESRELAELVW